MVSDVYLHLIQRVMAINNGEICNDRDARMETLLAQLAMLNGIEDDYNETHDMKKCIDTRWKTLSEELFLMINKEEEYMRQHGKRFDEDDYCQNRMLNTKKSRSSTGMISNERAIKAIETLLDYCQQYKYPDCEYKRKLIDIYKNYVLPKSESALKECDK